MAVSLIKKETKRTFILRIRKRKLNFLKHIMRKGYLESLTLIGDIKGKRDRVGSNRPPT